jgi:cytoplasmic iron level regulating protein YaaA (DUF328/UPF0246 family)
MLMLLSPAKSLNMGRIIASAKTTEPQFTSEISELATLMKSKSAAEIKTLMSISDKLAELNRERFEHFKTAPRAQALAAFDGDVYSGLDASSLSAKELDYAQNHLRILSGLYGLLRPLDLMQAYRLEMGTKLQNAKGEDLYDFWGDTLAKRIDADAGGLIINLASNEYFKAARAKAISTPIISPVFKERKDGQLKIISFYAKKARGTMARWIIQNQAESAEALQGFAEDGYRFDSTDKAKGELLFVRG